MDCQDVGLGEQHISGHGPHTGVSIEFVVRPDVVREDVGAECAAEARDLLADMTAAENADGRRRELAPDRLVPLPLTDAERERHDPAAQGDHQAQRQLGDRLPVDAGCPPDADAVAPRGVDVDHVEAHAVLADDAQVGHGTKQTFIECLESGDRLGVAEEEVDERGACGRMAGLVEPHAWVSLDQFGAQPSVS